MFEGKMNPTSYEEVSGSAASGGTGMGYNRKHYKNMDLYRKLFL